MNITTTLITDRHDNTWEIEYDDNGCVVFDTILIGQARRVEFGPADWIAETEQGRFVGYFSTQMFAFKGLMDALLDD